MLTEWKTFEYKGFVITIQTVSLAVGGYMATATIVDRCGEVETTPFESAVTKTSEDAEEMALHEAKTMIDEMLGSADPPS